MGITLDERAIIALLCYINLLNYIDRGIIPGAPESFQNFMTQTLGIPVTEQNVQLGLLSSAFIASTSVFSLIYGYLAMTYRPFQLIAWGMVSWIVAVTLCGVAYYADSYALLLFGRVLSGVGEASFHCNAMPFINRHAPKENSTLWLGIFIASITVGMAGGYVYGSLFASSSLTWAWAFFIEAILMVPPVLACWFCIPDHFDKVPTDDEHDTVDHQDSTSDRLQLNLLTNESAGPAQASVRSARSDESLVDKAVVESTSSRFVRQWVKVFQNVPFSLVIFGHAAYTFSLASFSVFSPVILIGMGFFPSEFKASLVFGALIVISGTIGTVVGGVALDRMTQGNSVPRAKRCEVAVNIIFYMILATVACALVMMLVTDSKWGFLGLMAVTFFFMSVIGPAETVAVMEFFPESRQAMAVAANTVVILLFGDVPSPVILGYLKDTWAPRCGTVEVDGKPRLNPMCHLDRSGLDGVLLFAVLWLLWAVLLWGIAKLLVWRRQRRLEKKASMTIESPAIQT
ncbi:hypothetical protein P43SY_004413 [Pythium insidiosum]|uniref:Major facilitator superfamily (MFS) profile domain-containing protein n=1 Tax=Pythium insidiosum TaxID=114742 RepID=A0AAD5LRT8_PYTIN|nr:hypothetical protein P43SY_004413 [Pythium insidiosum]